MKKTIMGLLLVGTVIPSQAQDVLYEAKLKREEVPEVVVASVETDFPDFIVEDFYAVPIDFVEDDVIIDRGIDSIDDYDTYQVKFMGKGEEMVATYDKDGNLLSSMGAPQRC